MTDLDAALEKDHDRGDAGGDSHAAGTPGGGTAYGGLAGTNIGDGDPDNANLEDAMGSGVRENEERIDDDEKEDAFGGIAGGAVGGTPANKRAKGGMAPDLRLAKHTVGTAQSAADPTSDISLIEGVGVMRQQKKQVFRKRLLELGQRVKGEVASLRGTALRASGGDASGNLSNAPLHLADLGTDNFQQQVDTGILEQEQQILGAIGVALDRLDAGTYGTCEHCGKKIAEARLAAVPYASRCIACEKQEEREKGVTRGPIIE